MARSQSQIHKRRLAYLGWLRLSEQERAMVALPLSKAAYARMVDVTPDTLQVWEQHPKVLEEWKLRDAADAQVTHSAVDRMEVAAQVAREVGVRPVPPPAPKERGPVDEGPAGESPVDDTLADYLTIKQSILRKATEEGDPKSQDMWMKTWGKPYLDAELAALESPFHGLSDEELVGDLLKLIPDGVLVAAVKARGLLDAA